MAIQIRRGTNSGWESNNANIVVGEPAVTTDTERLFVGTNTGAYAEFANINALAPAYSTSTQYYIGDYVTYQGKLYVCIENTSGAWDSTKWSLTNIGQAMSENLYANYESTLRTGDLVKISDGAGGIPVRDLKVNVEAVQSGSGDPSPDNVRPISGWSSVNVNVTGKNLYSSTNEQGVMYADGSTAGSNNRCRSKDYIPIKGGRQYIVKVYGENVQPLNVHYWDGSKTHISYYQPSSWSSTLTFTAPSNACYVKFNFWKNNNNFTPSEIGDVQLELGSTATAYEPYIGTTYTTAIGSTYYGGTLDVTTGLLTVTHWGGTFNDLSGFGYNSAGYFYISGFTPAKAIGNADLISSIFKTVDASGTASGMANGDIKGTTSNGNIFFNDTRYTTTSAFLADNGNETLCFKLATPQTVQLTPQQVRTLLHENNIWADSGSVYVNYRISNV